MNTANNQEEFEKSLKEEQPPAHWSAELRALWWDAQGDWSKAHACVDHLSTPGASWVHAYLHRKEGDLWNADYWYGRAGKRRPSHSLAKEFDFILSQFLSL